MTTHPYGAVRRIGDIEIVTPWLTAEEAAAYCGYGSAETIHKAARKGELITSGKGARRFHRDDLDNFLRGLGSGVRSDPSQPARIDTDAGDSDVEEMDTDRPRRNPSPGRRRLQDTHHGEMPADGQDPCAKKDAQRIDPIKGDTDSRSTKTRNKTTRGTPHSREQIDHALRSAVASEDGD